MQTGCWSSSPLLPLIRETPVIGENRFPHPSRMAATRRLVYDHFLERERTAARGSFCMRSASAGLPIMLMVMLSLAECGPTPSPTAGPVTIPEPQKPEPPRQPSIVPQPVAAEWKFQESGEACKAAATNPALTLDVAVSDDRLQLLAHAHTRPALRRGAHAAISFSGTSGSWTAPGRLTASHVISASQPMDEAAVGRVLVLLSGGTVQVGGPHSRLPPLRVPDAGTAGRTWFECVRRRLFP